MVKQVIVMRKDLNMRKGKMCAQAAHASIEVFLKSIREQTKNTLTININSDMNKWLETGTTKITVGCNNIEEIFQIQKLCKEKNVPCAVIEDYGKTEFKGKPTITCIAVGPAREEIVDSITGSYTLL